MAWSEIKKAVNSDLNVPLNELIGTKTTEINVAGSDNLARYSKGVTSIVSEKKLSEKVFNHTYAFPPEASPNNAQWDFGNIANIQGNLTGGYRFKVRYKVNFSGELGTWGGSDPSEKSVGFDIDIKKNGSLETLYWFAIMIEKENEEDLNIEKTSMIDIYLEDATSYTCTLRGTNNHSDIENMATFTIYDISLCNEIVPISIYSAIY